jgi:hypothetical protein
MSMKARVGRIQKTFEAVGLDTQTLKQTKKNQENRRLIGEYLGSFGIPSAEQLADLLTDDETYPEHDIGSVIARNIKKRFDAAKKEGIQNENHNR